VKCRYNRRRNFLKEMSGDRIKQTGIRVIRKHEYGNFFPREQREGWGECVCLMLICVCKFVV